jgi:hypothetical protein
MSVLDGFVRMRLYRERASEFELLAETEDLPEVRLRYRIVASHYRELVEREEKADKATVKQKWQEDYGQLEGGVLNLGARTPHVRWRLNSSGNFAIFTAIRRASSRVRQFGRVFFNHTR